MKTNALRLEWVEAASLAENPANWRRHSPEQLQSIKDLLADPDVGWAGAFLFNERTGRLIDGHARKAVVDPKEIVPVLVGNWSEEAEKKILATLDPVGAMATGDPAAYQALIEAITAESLWVRDLLHNTAAGLTAAGEALAFLRNRPTPLALYLFTRDRVTEARVLAETRSGGVAVNDTVSHIIGPHLPFGGLGESGKGAYHGKATFDCFSHRRSVLRRSFAFDPKLRYPPQRTALPTLKRVYRFLLGR